MTTTYDRMRAAAEHWAFEAYHAFSQRDQERFARYADEFRADADRLEALEKEMRASEWTYAQRWADTLRGDQS